MNKWGMEREQKTWKMLKVQSLKTAKEGVAYIPLYRDPAMYIL